MARREFSEFETTDTIGAGNSAEAFMAMGLKYCCGRDGAYDLIQAHKWFNIAALRGSADARRLRHEISAEMSRQDIASAQRMAREWLTRH